MPLMTSKWVRGERRQLDPRAAEEEYGDERGVAVEAVGPSSERYCQELCRGRLPDHAAATLMPSWN